MPVTAHSTTLKSARLLKSGGEESVRHQAAVAHVAVALLLDGVPLSYG
jgi:hypothetical protein